MGRNLTAVSSVTNRQADVENSVCNEGSGFSTLVLTTQTVYQGHTWTCFLPCDINILGGLLVAPGSWAWNPCAAPVCLVTMLPTWPLFPCNTRTFPVS